MSYEKLKKAAVEIALIDKTCSLLDWDQETMMPEKAAPFRAEQIALLTALSHAKQTSKKYESLLASVIDLESGAIKDTSLSPRFQASVKRFYRDFIQKKKQPKAFVEKFARLSSESMQVWGKAKKEDDFKSFKPWLEKIVAMTRQKAEYLGYQDHPYDALLNAYEPQLSVAKIEPLFKELKDHLTPLIKRIPEFDDRCIHQTVDPETQLKFSWSILEKMGYTKEFGRLDLSNHPFSSSQHPTDSRITTRIHPTNYSQNLLTVLHEGGHSLYEMGLPAEEFGTPLAEAVSFGIHESQSRFWETRIGLSEPFWHHFLPQMLKAYSLPHIDLKTFLRAINKVEPSFIRVEADEVTYPLHVILRYTIEKELLKKTLEVKDVPERWNSLMQELLGITPKTNREGCLQDVHWAMGGIGYFPTYTLGTLYASQFFETFAKAHPNWKEKVSSGELSFIRSWLKENIHQYGRQFDPEELSIHVTGKPLHAKPFLNYIDSKYKELSN